MSEVADQRDANCSNEEIDKETVDREDNLKAACEDLRKDYECEEGAEDDDDESDETETDNNKRPDKKLLKKKLKTDKKQDALKQAVGDLEDKVKRQMAEFDNFRKRTEKEKTMMFETGAKSVIEKILPVVDNFERGLATIAEEDKGSFADGMQMIYKQLMSELDGIGVKPIEAVGKEFNPDFHNAVMQVESQEYDTGIVAQELQKGYQYRETVIRHSMVAVVS